MEIIVGERAIRYDNVIFGSVDRLFEFIDKHIEPSLYDDFNMLDPRWRWRVFNVLAGAEGFSTDILRAIGKENLIDPVRQAIEDIIEDLIDPAYEMVLTMEVYVPAKQYLFDWALIANKRFIGKRLFTAINPHNIKSPFNIHAEQYHAIVNIVKLATLTDDSKNCGWPDNFFDSAYDLVEKLTV